MNDTPVLFAHCKTTVGTSQCSSTGRSKSEEQRHLHKSAFQSRHWPDFLLTHCRSACKACLFICCVAAGTFPSPWKVYGRTAPLADPKSVHLLWTNLRSAHTVGLLGTIAEAAQSFTRRNSIQRRWESVCLMFQVLGFMQHVHRTVSKPVQRIFMPENAICIHFKAFYSMCSMSSRSV